MAGAARRETASGNGLPRQKQIEIECDGNGLRKVHVKSFGCQMNVYDSHRMADLLAREGYAEVRARRGRSHHPQHLPHPREGGREGLFGARPHPQTQGQRGPCRPARRRWRWRAASPRPRARRSCAARRSSISWSGRRAITACRRCSPRSRAAKRSSSPNFRPRTSSIIWRRRRRRRSAGAASRRSSPCRKAATSSAPSASCPTRAARRPRGRSRASSPRRRGSPPPACARSP